jgi:hypothetical protein
MMKNIKTARDANKIADEFVNVLAQRSAQFNLPEAYLQGYLSGFLSSNADKKLLDALETHTKSLREYI